MYLYKNYISGAIDIVFVKQHDGTYLSTPFYVKFGKLGVLRAKEKRVYIEINGVELDKQMQLDDCGLAYFESIHQEEESDGGVGTVQTNPISFSGERVDQSISLGNR